MIFELSKTLLDIGLNPDPRTFDAQIIWIILGSILAAGLLTVTIFFAVKAMRDRRNTKKAERMVDSGEIKRDKVRKEIYEDIKKQGEKVHEEVEIDNE